MAAPCVCAAIVCVCVCGLSCAMGSVLFTLAMCEDSIGCARTGWGPGNNLVVQIHLCGWCKPCHRKAAEQLGYVCALDDTHVPTQYNVAHPWKPRKVPRTRRVHNLVVQITPLAGNSLIFALTMRERLIVEGGRLPLAVPLPPIG
jgi:hypothetical protein